MDVFSKNPAAEAFAETPGRVEPSQILLLLKRLSGKSVKRLLWLGASAGVYEAAIFICIYAQLYHADGRYETQMAVMFMLALLLFVTATRRFNRALFELVENYIAHLRQRILERVRETGLQTLEQLGSPTVYTALTFDVKAVSDVSHLLASLGQTGMWTMIMLLYVATLSSLGFLLILSSIGLTAGFYVRNQLRLKQAIYAVRDQETHLFASFTHLLNGFKNLRLNNRRNDDFFERGLTRHTAQARALKLHAERLLINNYTLSYILWDGLIIILVVGLPMLGLFSGKLLLTLAGIVLYLPISILIEHFPQFFQAGIAMQRLFAFEQTIEELTPEPLTITPEAEQIAFRNLRYQNLCFRYRTKDRRSFLVGPVSLTLKVGDIVFVTGGNGSGKTTLLKLLTGLYPPQSGRVYLNDQEVIMAQHRYLFAAVFHDYHLFDRLYGLSPVDPERIQTMLALLELDQKVRFVEGRFSTQNLSTGQRKRLALLTAMMEDKPIYVFDEWAAGQDPYFRDYFYLTLLPLLKAQGKTVLAVTHDDRYFHVADRIVKMEYGQIIEGVV